MYDTNCHNTHCNYSSDSWLNFDGFEDYFTNVICNLTSDKFSEYFLNVKLLTTVINELHVLYVALIKKLLMCKTKIKDKINYKILYLAI